MVQAQAQVVAGRHLVGVEQQAALGVEGQTAAVEDEFVIATDEIAVKQRAPGFGGVWFCGFLFAAVLVFLADRRLKS